MLNNGNQKENEESKTRENQENYDLGLTGHSNSRLSSLDEGFYKIYLTPALSHRRTYSFVYSSPLCLINPGSIFKQTHSTLCAFTLYFQHTPST